MKFLRTAILLAGFCLALNSTANAQDVAWKEHVYAADKMAITSPGDLALKTDSVSTDVGPVSTNFYNYTNPDGVYFGLVTCTYPSSVADQDPQKLLAGARDGMLSEIKATKTSEKAITIDGHPGLAIEYDVTASGIAMKGYSRLYMVGSSLYQIQVLGPAPKQEDVDKFLNSFRLVQ